MCCGSVEGEGEEGRLFLGVAQSELGIRLMGDADFINFSLLFLGSGGAGRGKGGAEEVLTNISVQNFTSSIHVLVLI